MLLSFPSLSVILSLSEMQAGKNMNLSTKRENRKYNIRFPLPDIPREKWCDFRIDFVENHMTLVQISEKYYCDPRTVRSCIQHNKSSFELGKKTTPVRIQIYENTIYELLSRNVRQISADISSVYGLSQYLYPILKDLGYSGSERTLRNHLQKQPYIKALLENHVVNSTLK